MELSDATDNKIRFLAEEKLFGIRKLIPIGGSYGLVIPKMWVVMNCVEIDGDYYLKLQVNGDELIFSPISSDDIRKVSIREKK